MIITWKDSNEGGSQLEKKVLIDYENPLIPIEETSINKIDDEIARKINLKTKAETDLQIATLKKQAIVDDLNIEL